MNPSRFLVLGAGVSGLACVKALQEKGENASVLEAEEAAGGLSKSEQFGRFTLDHSGHLLHLARVSSPAELPYAGLKNEEWERIPKKAFAWIGGRLVRAPVQYHLEDFDETLRAQCLDSFAARPALPAGKTVNLRDYLISGFGEKLSHLFLIPQNQKNLCVPLERLSADALKRFFPPPHEALITGSGREAVEYNSCFWYPRSGGIGKLAEGLARGCRGIYRNHRVVSVDLGRRTVQCQNGSQWRWEHLFSSLPLKDFCMMTEDEALHREAARLNHSSVAVVNMVLKKPLRGPLSIAHWIYTPEPEIPFYRAGVYSNLGEGQRDEGAARLYAEIGFPARQALSPSEEAGLKTRVEDALVSLGWIDAGSVDFSVVRFIRCAYVHYDPSREEAVAGILKRLSAFGISPAGRYGLWEYCSMEDSIFSAIDAVRKLA